ncbi:ECF transporter S component [Aerococcus kribbianus]|uniref:ECF transporter S component n=1 Tax=Aerococcus kribbianus TaxID=2999064 RepID=A0A9X3JH88_9LACT|nr:MULTISPECIES: ECF transporter S component [unclassified Aerococcus]MCZ0718102.1 ECF transporter S component [Aerococcus sp. YH-aer221]MCZ0726329.1 ECF transporter S component [Aerococcus sp. YH-aer222]
MSNLSTKDLVMIAMATAVIVAASMFILIPVPATHGFVTIVDAGIYLIAMAFGPLAGLLVGGLSGFLIDILSGAANWALFSAIIHGIQGFLFAKLYLKQQKVIAYLASSIFMVLGYALATVFMFDWYAGVASIPANCIQIVFSILLTELLGKRFVASLK